MAQQAPELYYRYEDVVYSPGTDEWGDRYPGPGDVRVHLREYRVLKRTPCGVWLDAPSRWSDRRFVRRDATKQFALPTIEEARVSFLARKKAQARIYTARLHRAEQAIRAMSPPRSTSDVLVSQLVKLGF